MTCTGCTLKAGFRHNLTFMNDKMQGFRRSLRTVRQFASNNALLFEKSLNVKSTALQVSPREKSTLQAQ